MSKSLGNVVDPMAIIDEYGVDAFRYFFVRHIPTFDDGDFTWEKFEAAYNGELANDLGNLVSRVANMTKRFTDGRTAAAVDFTWDKTAYDKYMGEFRFDLALGEVWGLVQHLNQYVDEKRPWAMAKSGSIEVGAVMAYLVAGLRELSGLIEPFLPTTAAKVTEIFAGDTVGDVPILFPKKYLHTEEPARK
jgi:methionyl-tRNA synthetase